jgi:hypothetical protein
MKRATLRGITIAFLLALVLSCSSDRSALLQPETGVESYRQLNVPENVIRNLELAYAKRDIDAFAGLLAPDFIFRFQPGDARELGRDAWGREEEIRSARGLFESTRVKDIQIRLHYHPAEPATEKGLEHTMKVVVTQAFLTVREEEAIYQVPGHPQEFFLRRGHGGHPERWMIVEWRDLPPR